jgi:hypothetical protein
MGFPLLDRTKKIGFFIISQLVDEERRKIKNGCFG